MRIKFLTIAGAMVLALGLAGAASAGTIVDTDSDLVPDVLDNCVNDANGPAHPIPQNDFDGDGFGNACDCDFDQNNDQNGLDITQMFTVFLTPSGNEDMDSNGEVNGLDIVNCFSRFLTPPG
jgi:hypothetical protein